MLCRGKPTRCLAAATTDSIFMDLNLGFILAVLSLGCPQTAIGSVPGHAHQGPDFVCVAQATMIRPALYSRSTVLIHGLPRRWCYPWHRLR